MPAFFDRAPSHLWKKLAFVCLGVLVLMACYWAYLYQSHHDQLEKTEQQAVLRSIQVANALTHQTEALLRNMGFIVRHLGEHWAGQDTAEFRRVIGIAQSTLPKEALVQIAITDAHGNVVFSNLTPLGQSVPTVSIADRAHFKVHWQTNHSALYISEPVWGRVSGQWVVQFSHALRTPQSDLAYVMVASVSVEYLTEAFRQVLPDPQDVVALVNHNGHYLARSHHLTHAMEMGLPSELVALNNLSQHSGVYQAAPPVDGIVRYYAWQRIADYPLVLHLGLGKDKVLESLLAQWRNSRTMNAVASLLFLLAALWISYLTLIKASQRQQLEQSQEHLYQVRRALLDQSSAAILLVNFERWIIQVSMRAEQLFAPQGGTLVGQHASVLHIDAAHSQAIDPYYQQLHETGVARLTYPLKDATGATRWFDMHANLYDPGDPQSPAVWTMIDVTDAYVAEKNLEIQSTRLTTLLEQFPAGVLLEDADSRVVMVNRAFCTLLGLQQEPQTLKNLSHTALLQQLSSDCAAWLPLPCNTLDQRRTTQITQISDGQERFLEIDWVPIVRAELSLGHVWLLRDVTERKRKEKQLAVLASTDTLTNLPNRRSFMAMLEQHLQSQDSTRPHGALLMIDIDHFKKVNDTYGHPVGDLVLQQMAQVMRQSLREKDYAARFGGEEFVVLLYQTTLQESQQLAQRLREGVAAHLTDAGTAGKIAVTISIGLVELRGLDSKTALARADKALYAAKAAGRNRVCIASEELEEKVTLP